MSVACHGRSELSSNPFYDPKYFHLHFSAQEWVLSQTLRIAKEDSDTTARVFVHTCPNADGTDMLTQLGSRKHLQGTQDQERGKPRHLST